jgi:excisionase family DNA binding protein
MKPSKTEDDTLIRPITYSVEMAVNLSGLPRSKLYEAIRDGELRSTKKGKRRLIFHDGLVEYLNNSSDEKNK